MSILKVKAAPTRVLSFRLPLNVIEAFDAVKQDAASQGMVLDLTPQVERLVISATKQARAELGPQQGCGSIAELPDRAS